MDTQTKTQHHTPGAEPAENLLDCRAGHVASFLSSAAMGPAKRPRRRELYPGQPAHADGQIRSWSAATSELDQCFRTACSYQLLPKPARHTTPWNLRFAPTETTSLVRERATYAAAIPPENVPVDAGKGENRPRTKEGVLLLFGIHPHRHLKQLAHQRYELFVAHRTPVHMLTHDDAVPRIQDQ